MRDRMSPFCGTTTTTTPGGYDTRKPDIIEAMSALLESLPEDYESVEVRSTRGHSLRLSR